MSNNAETNEIVMDAEQAIEEYMNNMSDADKIAYKIAVKQLESSFDMVKSIGFMDYINKNNIVIKKNN
tara:strand:- start:243 stop:446 length:204 start_codon:yes stop_codon:yes gene_type:complete